MKYALIILTCLLLCCPVTVSAQTLEQAKKQQVERALNGPNGQQIKASVKKYSEKYNVDEKMVHAIILTESGYNPRAISPCGAKGLGQLMEPTFKARQVGTNIFDIDTNIHALVKHYAGLLGKYKGNTYLSLAAYNAGGGYVDRYKGQVPPSIKPYVNKVYYYKGIIEGITF